MPRVRPRAAAVAALLVLGTACQPENKSTQLTVMSRNVYLGADLDPILFALVGFETGQLPPDQFNAVIGPLADQAWLEVQATDFPARAKVIAGEIAGQQADVVGLQEAALWRTGTTAPATTVAYDFVELVRAELAHLGLSYQVADVVQDTDGEFPLTSGALVRFTDRDAILVRADVATSDPRHGNYVTKFPLLTASGPMGMDLSVLRGWTSVEVQKDGVRFRVYDTHLEVENPPLNYFQAGQAAELAGILTAEPLPAIVLGDFNSDGNQMDLVSSTPTYPLMRDLGFGDPWAELHPGWADLPAGSRGETFCGATDPTFTALTPCDARLDHNFYRGGFSPLVSGEVTMTTTPSGIYDSDHKAMWTRFEITVPGAR